MTNPYDTPSDPAKRHSSALTDGPDRGQKALYVEDMRLLFERNVFPEGYRATVARASALGCIIISFGLLGFGGIYGHIRRAYGRL